MTNALLVDIGLSRGTIHHIALIVDAVWEKVIQMTNGEAVNWIINISADIGKAEHRDLWHYEQALSEIREMLESAEPEERTETHACDCISRQAAIDAFEPDHRVDWYTPMIIDVLKALPSAEPEPHWIPTSKERPPQHQEIWITDDLGIVKLVYGKVGVWWLDENYYTEPEIIAWMPANVPEPYQPKEE